MNQQLLIPDSPTFLIFNMVYRALFNHIEIIINNPTDIPTRVSVYAVNGNLVRQEKVVGTFAITVSPGIYLVKAGRKTEKVVVK